MPPKSKSPESGSVSRNKDVDGDKLQKNWGGYVDLKIDEETKVQFSAWYEAMADEIWSHVSDTVDTGLKFGVGWDAANDCYISSFTGNGVKGNADRFCLTARSARMDESIALLVFKHVVMMNCDWATHFRPRGNGFSWG